MKTNALLALCDEALKLDLETTPGPWVMSAHLDAGDGRSIEYAAREPRFSAIRVSCPMTSGVTGYWSMSPKQRDRDAEFIARAREILPLLAFALRERLPPRSKG